MKKIICLILLLVFALAACGETAPTDKETKPKEEYSYVVVDDYVIYDEYLGDKENVVIPDKIKGLPVKIINKHAFAYSDIKTVKIPDTVVKIDTAAFVHCQKLESVEFGNNLEIIGSSVFFDCPNLKSIELPKSLKEIGFRAFLDCEKLKDVVIPENVAELGSTPFSDTVGTLKFLGDVPQVNRYTFSKNVTVYYSKDSEGWDRSVYTYEDNFVAY